MASNFLEKVGANGVFLQANGPYEGRGMATIAGCQILLIQNKTNSKKF